MQNDKQKSEEVLDIIERMPSKFGLYTTIVMLLLVTTGLLLAFIIQYPDTVNGPVVINTKYTTVKLVSNASGRLTLLTLKSKDEVNDDDYIAVIQNPANTNQVRAVLALLAKYDLNKYDIIKAIDLFPKKALLGEVDSKYFLFLNAMQQLYNYKVHDLFEKQKEAYEQQIEKLNFQLNNDLELKNTQLKSMRLAKSLSDKDSVLLAKKYATEEELDRSTINYLNSKGNLQKVLGEINSTQAEIDDYQNKLVQLNMQHADKQKQLEIDLVNTYADLRDNLKAWEQRYVFKSPMKGKVEFLQFWHNDQYVAANEDVFAVVPEQNAIIGQVYLPAAGAGKVQTGQDVIIKLNNYPSQEYGFIEGKVKSISLTTNVMKSSNQSTVDTYLVEVVLPAGLKTNFGTKLAFRYELKGTAEIVSKHRRLIERLFDNLRSAVDKD